MQLAWNVSANKKYYLGVSKVALFVGSPTPTGYAWDGVINVDLSPEGGEATTYYANNNPYVTLLSNEKTKGTIKAYTYPDAFAVCDGLVEASANSGVYLGQQQRVPFSLVYAQDKGSDADPGLGKVYRVVYNCLISPSSISSETINESPSPAELEWEFTSTAVPASGFEKAVSVITIDTETASPAFVSWFEDEVYGTATTDPTLPDPDTIVTQAGIL